MTYAFNRVGDRLHSVSIGIHACHMRSCSQRRRGPRFCSASFMTFTGTAAQIVLTTVLSQPSMSDSLKLSIETVTSLCEQGKRLPETSSHGEPWLAANAVVGFYLPSSSGARATPRNASPARAERIVTNRSR